MITYRHTQVGRALMVSLLLLAIALLPVGLFVDRTALVAPIVLALSAFLFGTLTITIEDGTLRARFGPGPAWKRCAIGEIAECRPTQIRWWWGWGVHLTPRGWLFNVAGFRAVEITTRNGRRFLLGTDQPEELAAAIRRAASAT